MGLNLQFELPKPPRTKKNHGSVKYSFRKKRKVHVPSEAWSKWLAWCQVAMPEIRRAAEVAGVGLPITIDVNCRATFYRHAEVGDAVGFYQGLADVLEAIGVLENDKQIVSWDGTRLRKDADDPRTVVILEGAENDERCIGNDRADVQRRSAGRVKPGVSRRRR